MQTFFAYTLSMPKKDWTLDAISPDRDYYIGEIARLTNITKTTLYRWRKIGRLATYQTHDLICGKWIIRAIRDYVKLTDAEIKARHRKKHPLRQLARYTVTRALQLEILKRMPCEICGSTDEIEAHHKDYFKLLDVNWLCREHHLITDKKRLGGLD